MNWKTFITGAAAGFAAGYVVKELSNKKGMVSPEKVLTTIKTTLGDEGTNIRGSWIMMKPEKYTRNYLDYDVYKGGLTKVDGHESSQFEFIADANTGTILDIYQAG
ncbi:hypothetical protein CYL18_13080 [Pradoshia eiseniae]|uniref:PepSY domain-containing protein n=1 Tax=Pradoshia eiseniae TaxID=2064768 RepID=A0A2S7MXR6_9BACI|nr:hypothetical protein [Pradoshia eiseniae]PQD94594.1 hypothetical protein CYL18_13080 [Pradoshia eiseniae]